MTTPRIIASGQGGAYDLNDGQGTAAGTYCELAYEGVQGLLEPAALAMGAVVDTFDGPVPVRTAAANYPPREFSLSGWVPDSGGRAELVGQMQKMWRVISGRPSQVQAGSLVLDCEFGQPKFDRLRDNAKKLGWSITGRGLPALYKGLYGYATGISQTIPIADDRLDRTELKLGSGTNAMVDVTGNGRVFTVYNPGSAPCDLPLIVSGLTAATTYYLVNTDQRAPNAVVFTTAAATTTFTLSAAYGVKCFPGTNTYRLQSDTSGTLVTSGTYLWAIPGNPPPWRWLGNDADRFNEGPAVLTTYRRGVANYNSAAATQAQSVDMQARIGLPNEAAGAYTAAKAGLVLETATTNLCTSNQATGTDTSADTTGFAAVDTGPTLLVAGATISSDGTQFFQGSKSLKVVTSGVAANEGFCTAAISATANTVHYVQLRIKQTAGGDVLQAFVRDYTNAVQTLGASLVLGSTWNLVTITITTGANPVTDLRFGVRNTGVAAATFFVDALQVEAKPFATSWVDGTRNADQCAVWLPHNYLKYSRDLTQSTAWTATGTSSAQPTRAGTGADGTATCSTWNILNIDNRCKQVVTPDVRPNSSGWTLVVALRQGTLIGANNFDLRIEDQGGTLIGTATTVTASALSASTTNTYYVSVTASQVPTTATGLQVALQGKTGTGTVLVESVALLKGAFPGPVILTESTNLPLPQQGWEWPTWLTQNGYIEVKAVLPIISTGLTYYVFGNGNEAGRHWIQRLTTYTAGQNYLRVGVDADGGGGTQFSAALDVGNVWDGALHTFRLTWRHYTTSGGTETMDLLLDVDGVNKYTSANLFSATVTAWSRPERLWLSGGEAIATLRNLAIGMPALPSGATPAAISPAA